MFKYITNFFSKKQSEDDKDKSHVEIGQDYETLAIRYLKKHGYKILQQNFHSRFGEIDIIAKNKEYTCFVEVKGRIDANYGDPQDFVIAEKIKRIRKTAAYYVMKHNLENTCLRFDVLSIVGDSTNYEIECCELNLYYHY